MYLESQAAIFPFSTKPRKIMLILQKNLYLFQSLNQHNGLSVISCTSYEKLLEAICVLEIYTVDHICE